MNDLDQLIADLAANKISQYARVADVTQAHADGGSDALVHLVGALANCVLEDAKLLDRIGQALGDLRPPKS